MNAPRLSVVLMAMIAAIALAACASAPTPAPTSAPPTAGQSAPTEARAATAPTASGVLRFRLTRDPRTLEPGLFLELITGWIAKDLHAGLVRFDDKMQVVPFIAQEWSASADGLTYTFKLRDDVKFHNGRRVTADDFVYTFTRILNPKVKAAAGPSNLARVKGAKDFMDGKATAVEGLQATDATTFKIVLSEPDPSLILRLATPFMAVIPKEAVVDGEAK